MNNHKDILKAIEDFDSTPQGRGFDLRLDLADIILRRLKAKGWTQNQLAAKAKMKAPQITGLIHSATNWTTETAGRILHALDVKVKLVEDVTSAVSPDASRGVAMTLSRPINGHPVGHKNGKKRSPNHRHKIDRALQNAEKAQAAQEARGR